MQELIEADRSLLLFFNSFHTTYLDQVFWIITGKIIWIPLILSFVWLFFRKGLKEATLVILMLALTVILCDQLSSTICKPLFCRLRPSQDPYFSQFVNIVCGYRGGRYGFISGHAANSFGIALFSILLFKNKFFTFSVILWALLSCYSRMYLGVHYPGDILFGAIAGAGTGCLIYFIYKKLHKKLFKTCLLPYGGDKNIKIPLIILYATYLLILTLAPVIDFRIR
ncbi:MAG: phosphatase PAP2 family protein [Bacteroidales bacterium]